MHNYNVHMFNYILIQLDALVSMVEYLCLSKCSAYETSISHPYQLGFTTVTRMYFLKASVDQRPIAVTFSSSSVAVQIRT